MRQTLENIAAIKLRESETAMKQAAAALDDVGSDETKQHAKELRGATKMVRTWERALRKLHDKKQAK